MRNFIITLSIVIFLGWFLPLAVNAASTSDRSLTLVTKSKRVALVIGNGDYKYSESLPKLANPPNDAEDIAVALRRFGFDVIEKQNLTQEEMDSAIAEFGRKSANSEAALFYFAGHGLQVKGQNYLVPVDARIESEAQIPYKSINVNQLLEEMDNGKSRANIVMLDACRNNPLSGRFRSGATHGLAAPATSPKGTVIVYATDPGGVAADGDGRNGLFTAGLLSAFNGNDLSLGGVLSRASEEVERSSEQKQTPYINGPATLQKNFQFAPDRTVKLANRESIAIPEQSSARVKSHEEIEQDGWESARESANIVAIKEYLNQYPKGRFAGHAKILLATLQSKTDQETEPRVSSSRDENEDVLWTEVQKGNSADDYNTYLEQYPKGKYSALAKTKIKKIQEEAAIANRVKLDNDEALSNALQRQAEAGNLGSMLAMAQRYDTGIGVKKNPSQAAYWRNKAEESTAQEMLRAANAGNVAAMENMAVRYDTGQGVEKSPDQARAWRSKAKQHKIINFSYIENVDRVSKQESFIVALISFPISLASDIVSLPDRSTQLNKLKNEAVSHPSTWGKPDSMIARASQQLMENSTPTDNPLFTVATK